MARRKSDCVKWTLILVLVIFSQYVYSRPQIESTTLGVTTNATEKSTEDPLRYSYGQNNDSLVKFTHPTIDKNNLLNDINAHSDIKSSNISLNLKRRSRVIRKKLINRPNHNRLKETNDKKSTKLKNKVTPSRVNDQILTNTNNSKPVIKKIVTKWTDNAKYEDLNISDERDDINEHSSNRPASSSENYSSDIHKTHFTESNNKQYTHLYQRPRPPVYSAETQFYSNNFQLIDNPYATRPNYIFTTPTPTPIITNVGYPKPWPAYNYQSNRRPTTTKKPIKSTINPYNYQKPNHDSNLNFNQNFSPYPDNNIDSTTFSPTNDYTDRIVIRPEDYSASSDDCPTIFVTLNNTFQGQGKEACPDLNIAVNTNVINKNVVVESEEDTDMTLTEIFGLPTDYSSSDEGTNDYTQSQENDEETSSASVEGLDLSSYHAANSVSEGESSEAANVASPSNAISTFTKPNQPNDNDDDMFGFSSVIDFFRPAIGAFSWLAAINPLSFSALSFLLTPLVLLFAGTSGITALFSPWSLSGREAPEEYFNRPQWQWDDYYKTWYLNSNPDDRAWEAEDPRGSTEGYGINSIRPTWFYKVKQFLKALTKSIRDRDSVGNRKNKRRKRETWTLRFKTSSDASEENKKLESAEILPAIPNDSRNVKNKIPIGESIKKVATQLLDKPNKTGEVPVVPDTRIPPKIKTQFVLKSKIKTRTEDAVETSENSHTGIAVPVTMEELEMENKDLPNESSTTNEGISTWILLSNPVNNDNTSASTEPTQSKEIVKKPKPTIAKNKTKRPQNKVPIAKRPIIGSTNKADLVAGGSAINENVYNKIKDTVLSNVQKNKSTPPRATTTSSTTSLPSTEALTTKAPVAVVPVVKVTSKPPKKSNKIKQKVSTTVTTSTITLAPIAKESAILPMEPKEQEIELEISTPATTTKKPKRTSSRKKTKTKKRKTAKPKPEATTALTSDVKTTNKTKITKTAKKPTNINTKPFTAQIYNYFSREVMPSVGVGVIGLAGLVGLASYFLYPFASPVRRTIEVDKKDDIYRHNAEEYANEGNGQPEEEMLGTVLAGMPIHSKQKLNPYAGQTAYINRYSSKKDQDLRYRHVTNNYETSHNAHYPQQKTGIAHGAVYTAPYNYNRYQYETRHAYTTEKKYDKGQTHSPYPAVEPIYAAPQAESTGISSISSFGNDASSSVVYGVKPSQESDFKPVYRYDTQFYAETTSSPLTYPPTSMYLGSNNEAEETDNSKYSEENNPDEESADNKFVVGNVPKELTETATPVVVPEHGPRKLNRKRRNTRRKRSIVTSIEEILKAAKHNKDNEIFISNEIDEENEGKIKPLSLLETMQLKNEQTTPENKEVFTVYAVSVDPAKEFPQTEEPSIIENEVIESVSTLPLDNKKDKATETEISNELDTTTKAFKVYEIFPTGKSEVTERSSPLMNDIDNTKSDYTAQTKNMNTETTTEIRSETPSTMPPSPPPVSITTSRLPRPTYRPETITYPPSNGQGGIFDFLKRIVEFKYRLGLSILQSTSESLNRYLRSLDA